MNQDLPRYQIDQSYRWNFEHAPDLTGEVEVPSVPGSWHYCGRAVPSPLAIAAGPLLNGQWILYYAALGFDVLTYKTVRSRERACYELPNLAPVACEPLSEAGATVQAASQMAKSWAVSFGMPSMSPDFWRADIERTRRLLPREKLLAVSVVASPEPGWTVDDLAADFAQCARWAVESGADSIETNFSCPNVDTSDGQLYQQSRSAGVVAARVRETIGDTPLVIKIGFLVDDEAIEALLADVAAHVDALAMTNCISARVQNTDGDLLFGGSQRGIGGEAIRVASVNQLARFKRMIDKRGDRLRLIGVGGIATVLHVQEYLAAGAEAVQLATAAMIDPLTGVRIRQGLANWHGTQNRTLTSI